MSDLTTQLDTLKTNNTADAETLTAIEADLAAAPTTTADQALAAVVPVLTTAGLVDVFGVDALTAALVAKGFTVSAPAVNVPVTTP